MSGLGLLTVVLLVLPAVMSGYLGIYSWQRRTIPGAVGFACTMFITVGWALTAALVVVNDDPAAARWWLKLMFITGTFLPVGILAAAAQTTGHGTLVQPSRLIVWLVIPIVTSILTLTSDSHNWYLYDIQFVRSGAQNIGWINGFGPWAIIHLAYSYVLVLYSMILLIQQFVKMRYRTYRMRIFLLLVGLALPFLTNIVNSLLLETRSFITPIMLNLSTPIFFWVLFRYRLFDLLPIARDQAFEHMEDAIIIVDEQNRVVDVNRRAALLAQQRAADLIEKPLTEVYPVYQEAFTQALETGAHRQPIETYEETQPAYFDLSIVPINRDEERVGKLIILADRTEQRLAEARAHHIETERERVRTLSEFVGAASHEFRTPLAVIKNAVYLIDHMEDPAKRAEKTSQIDHQVNILTRLVEGLITIVKLDAEVNLTFHALDMNAIVLNVVQRVRPDANEKGLVLEAQLAADLPRVLGSVTYLQEAVHAVLHNAIRYTKPGGSVTVRTLQREGQVIVSIQDTGIGIEAEHLPHIFDVFYRVDKARRTSGFGTGLAIASRVVRLHGGHIQAASRVESGTTIEMTFPPAASRSKT